MGGSCVLAAALTASACQRLLSATCLPAAALALRPCPAPCQAPPNVGFTLEGPNGSTNATAAIIATLPVCGERAAGTCGVGG